MANKGNDQTLSKVGEDEPIFVLRAQDSLAPDIIRAWALNLHARCGKPIHYVDDCLNRKVKEAMALANEMEAWPNRKLPD